MPELIGLKMPKNRWIKDIFLSVFIGLLSVIFGLIKIQIPGIEGAESNFMETPLLIYLFYLKHPVFILFTSIFTLVPMQDPDSYLATYLMHVVGLLIGWFIVQLMKSKLQNDGRKILSWVLFTFIYYVVLLIPILILINYFVGLNEWNFVEDYFNIIYFAKFEIISTILVTGLYLLQFEIRKKLEDHKNSLEQTVKDRTHALATANNQLKSLNSELIDNSNHVKQMNENLDDLVKKRSEKIEIQLEVLDKYTHMNSHELHASLASMLGLLNLINLEIDKKVKKELLEKLNFSAIEMDEIIIKMNRLLEKEIIPNPSTSDKSKGNI